VLRLFTALLPRSTWPQKLNDRPASQAASRRVNSRQIRTSRSRFPNAFASSQGFGALIYHRKMVRCGRCTSGRVIAAHTTPSVRSGVGGVSALLGLKLSAVLDQSGVVGGDAGQERFDGVFDFGVAGGGVSEQGPVVDQ
jgi:hypothetical protein